MTVTPFRNPSNTTRPMEAIQNDLNAFAGRGVPLGVTLADAYRGGRSRHGLVPSGSGWGTTNVSSFLANAASMLALTTVSIATGTLVAVPFIHDNGFGIGGCGFRVTTGAANAVAVFGIYASIDDLAGNPYPGQKLWQSTQVTPTANNTTHEQAPNLSLEPGRVYWIAYHCGTNAPTLVALAVGGVDTVIGHISGVGGIAVQTYLSGSRTYSSTLPSIYPAGQTAVATAPPALFYWYNPRLQATMERTYPIWSAPTDGWTLSGLRVLPAGRRVVSVKGAPSATITGRITTGGGSLVIGRYDSVDATLVPGKPFALMAADESREIPAGAVVDVVVAQRGWPALSIDGCRVSCEIARTRP